MREDTMSLHKSSTGISLVFTTYNAYLLLAEFSARTVNYGPSFSLNGKKRGSVIYSRDRKNQANKMIGCRPVCYHICRRNYSFSLTQNISNLCQSIFVFLTMYYDKIFKHCLESSLIRLRVSFFIVFVHK